MSTMMKALRFHGQRDLRLEELEVPVCGKDQVKVGADRRVDFRLRAEQDQIKPAFVGICGTGIVTPTHYTGL